MKVHKNILSKKERLKILKFIKTVIKDLGPDFPGLQSEATLHGCKKLEKLLDKINVIIKGYRVHRCWANFSNGNYISWHSHAYCDKSLVYYLKNKSNIGTMFKKKENKVEVTKALENSLLIFDSNLIHSVPCHLPEDRYSIAFDLVKQ